MDFLMKNNQNEQNITSKSILVKDILLQKLQTLSSYVFP